MGTLSVVDVKSKQQCLMSSTGSPEFIECYKNVTETKEKDCE